MTDSIGAEADLLVVAPEIASVPGVEAAIRRSVSRLAGFRHPAFCELRSVEKFGGGTLAVVSDAAHGLRLAEILSAPPDRKAPLDLAAALHIIRQAIAAIDALHGYGQDMSHGAIGPERLVLNGRGRVIVADYALASALEQLRYSHQHYWRSLRIQLPRSAGLARFDQRVDLAQLGVLALTLMLGRLLKDDEYSAKLVDIAGSFQTIGITPDRESLRPEISTWLQRTMQIDQQSFASAAEARIELESVLTDEERAAGQASVERLIARLGIAPEPIAPTVTLAPLPPAPKEPEPVRKPEPVIAAAPPPPPPPRAAEPVPPKLAHAGEGGVVMPLAARVDVPPAPEVRMKTDVTPNVSNPMSHAHRAARPSHWKQVAVAVVALAFLTSGGLYALRRRAPSTALLGTLTVQSNPSGVPIDIDGIASGVTPATLSVPAGTHTLMLRSGGEPKTMTVAVGAGAQISQYIELAKTRPTSGGLIVRTEPAGAQVSIDRVSQGASPITAANLAPGDHTVVVTSDGVSVEQIVTVEAGTTSSLVVPIAARDRGPVSGWIAVAAPIDVQIFESGKLLGTSQMDRIMVPAGEHKLDLVNDSLGYR
ncbi:MAG TPA: PEGA domain-containing protein, partial [Vicinamibacterales bacterium]|nr:PEGA domain-containing protein [Vicinamibacterales bacterium]